MLSDEELARLRGEAEPSYLPPGVSRRDVRAMLDTIDELKAQVKPPSGQKPPPASPASEASIRDDFTHHRYGPGAEDDVRDLLAIIDHERARADECEAWCARIANDREGETALMEAGVAKALAVLLAKQKEYQAARDFDGVAVLTTVMNRIDDACGPSALSPHLVTLARLRRLETTAAELARIAGNVSHSADTEYGRALSAVRAALGEDA